ncbi:hypothetical protein Tco_1060008, partial [Tanacetum coccineum]
MPVYHRLFRVTLLFDVYSLPYHQGLLTVSVLVDACSLAFDPHASTLTFDPHASTLALEDASNSYDLANIHALAFSMSFQDGFTLLSLHPDFELQNLPLSFKIKISDMIQNGVWEECVGKNVVDKVYWLTKDGKNVLGLKLILLVNISTAQRLRLLEVNAAEKLQLLISCLAEM